MTLISVLQYFTLSGLRTNLGSLNNGVTWGWTILLCTVSFFAKSVPCFTVAKLFGFNLRESAAIGALMSCKG
jgi:Kef-type K+ transport system membrane component KefB